MTDEHERNVFFGIPILGFFRNKRRVNVPESRPLIPRHHHAQASTTRVSFRQEQESSNQFSFEQQGEPPRRKKSAKELWGILRENVRNETFHIQDWRTKTERIRTKSQEKHFKEMSLPYEYGVVHCICAWCIYLGISVLAYSFLFEQWTVIESMYFACVSFTTIGEYGCCCPYLVFRLFC